jgi:hypothetical protein
VEGVDTATKLTMATPRGVSRERRGFRTLDQWAAAIRVRFLTLIVGVLQRPAERKEDDLETAS